MTKQPEIQAKKFQQYHRLWLDTAGPDEASSWIAATVGVLVAQVAALEKQVKRLERPNQKPK